MLPTTSVKVRAKLLQCYQILMAHRGEPHKLDTNINNLRVFWPLSTVARAIGPRTPPASDIPVAKGYPEYYNAQCHPFRRRRKRNKRPFLVAPLRRTILWGRACGTQGSQRNLPDG